MESMNFRTWLTAGTAMVAALTMAQRAEAQVTRQPESPSTATEVPAPVAGTPRNVGLEEIVVTARKREERLQDVGSSVSALSASELARRPDLDLSSFANSAPNVVISDMQEGPGSPASMSIRGIGTSDHERSIDPTVGVVVDGVFIGTVGGAMVKAIDLQRLEILRGPQGTLFGRNSIGGAILLDRRKPSLDGLGGEVRLGYGNYDTVTADGYVNVPVTSNLAFKFGGAFSRHDGYTQNITLDRRQGKEKYTNLDAAVYYEPTSSIKLYYRYDKSWTKQDAAALQNVAAPDQVWCFYYNQCAADNHTPQGGSRYKTVQNSPGFNAYFNSDLHVASAHWDIGSGLSLDYLFGLFKTKEDGHWDFDATPLSLYDTQRPQQYHQTSNEFRLNYKNHGPLSFTVGLYGFNSRYHINNMSYIGFGDFLFGLPPGTVLYVPQEVGQRTKSYAAFFEGDMKITDALTLTVGGRYTKDRKSQSVADPLFPQLLVKGGFEHPVSKSWGQFTPKVGLRYRFNRDLMAYALFSRGFRAGGFSGRPGTYEAATTPYDPETVDNYELGFKSEWLEHRLRINASAYSMNYKKKQEELSVPVNIVGGTGQQTLFVNAATAKLQGFEIEVAVMPIRGLTINSSFGYLDAKYTKFSDPLTGLSLTYLRLRRTPKYTFSLSPAYEFRALGGKATVSADWHYLSGYENTFWNTPQARNGGSHVVDAQLSWTRANTTVAFFGRNLTKDDSYTIGLDVGRSATFPGLWTFVATRPPRTFGLTVSQKF